MTPERWRQVEALFDLVVELPAVERRARLESSCVDDDDLHREVASLLDSLEGAPTRISDVIGREAEQLAAPALGGRELGPWRILDKLGEGGMGVVYLAERVDGQYQAKVAIKLLRGLESQDAVARFRDERQILATLEHPGIVRLLDGGSSETGQPYLVMEYVAGVPISRYVVEHQLDLPARIELFNRVAAAVGFAHRCLVVHRDLKPSNILVNEDGAPKLLDFGIAKLLAPVTGLAGAGKREAQTRTGLQLLTPEYASPEQVRGEPISIATDVYSLGLVLYELCTDAKAQPIVGEGVAGLLRAILDDEAPRPSSVAPRSRRRALQGDLDNIILKAMHKQPAQRYASVEQLIEDIERHLDGLPVKARTATFGYRAGKFVRRNLVGVVAAIVVLGTLAAATVVSLRQARRADEQAANAEWQRQLADEQTRLARQQAEVARARARTVRDVIRVTAAQQASEDPTLAVVLLRELETRNPEQSFGWLRAVPHFSTPAFVIQTEVGEGRIAAAAWSPDGTRFAVARFDNPTEVWSVEGTRLATLAGEAGRARDAAWNPEGTHLVTASSNDVSARVWTAEGSLVAVLDGHSAQGGSGLHVAWSPDGTRISTAANDQTVRLWRVDGTPLVTLDGHASESWTTWSPDGARLVTGSPSSTSARVWTADGTLVATLVGHRGGIYRAAWSPAGDRIVTPSDDASARVWRVDGVLIATLDGHDGSIAAVAWSPDGQRIATASNDRTARVWRADGEELATLAGHERSVLAIQWSPDGQQIATASEDRTARVWRADGTHVATLVGHRESLRSIEWRPSSPAPQLLSAAFDGTVRTWQAEQNLPAVIPCHADELRSVAWSPDGTRFATASDDRSARVWQADGTLLATLVGHEDSVVSVMWSPDASGLLSSSADRTARVWRADGTPVATLSVGPDDEVLAATWGPSIATAHADGQVRVWKPDGTLLRTLTGHEDAVRSVAWSRDGRLLTASWDATARVWASDGTLLATLTGHEQAVQSAAWSPDGTRIATASMDRSARIWQSDGTPVAVLAGQSEMETVAWSPDGTRLVTTSMEPAAHVWRADGTLVAKLAGHRNEITSVVWSSEGSRILSATLDDGARLWNADGLLLATLEHGAPVASASFGPGDTHVVTAGHDGKLRIWLVDAAQLLRGFWSSTPRCLAIADRQRVLAESRADAEFGATACRAMHDCLRDEAGEVVPERFEACLDDFHARRDTYYF